MTVLANQPDDISAAVNLVLSQVAQDVFGEGWADESDPALKEEIKTDLDTVRDHLTELATDLGLEALRLNEVVDKSRTLYNQRMYWRLTDKYPPQQHCLIK